MVPPGSISSIGLNLGIASFDAIAARSILLAGALQFTNSRALERAMWLVLTTVLVKSCKLGFVLPVPNEMLT